MFAGVGNMLTNAAGPQDQHGAPLEALIGVALPQSLFLLFPIKGNLAHQAEQMTKDILAHQRAEDAADIGELIVAATVRVEQHIDSRIGGLEPAQLVGFGQQRFGTGRFGHQNMGFADQLLGIALVIGSQNAQMGEIGGLEQPFVVSIILAEQKKGTLAHTLVPYQNLRRNKMPLSTHLT